MPSSSRAPRNGDPRRERRRRTHRRVDSSGELLGDRQDPDTGPESPSTPSKQRPKRTRHRSSRPADSDYSRTTSTALSSDQLAQLDKLNRQLGWSEYDRVRRPRDEIEVEVEEEIEDEPLVDDRIEREREAEERERARERERRRAYRENRRRQQEEDERAADFDEEERRRVNREKRRRRREEEARAAELDGLRYDPRRESRRESRQKPGHSERRRVVSGTAAERGDAYYSEKEEYRHDVRRRDGSSSGGGGGGGGGGGSGSEFDDDARRRKRRRNIIIIAIVVFILLLAIVIPVAVVESKKSDDHSNGNSTDSSNSSNPSNSNLDGISESSIPASAQGTYLDPFTWYDTTDFNVTYTGVMVGNLSIMGLNSTWNDSARANSNVPPLNQKFNYGTTPIRGVNLGGWLSIEPFITPSLFSGYTTHDNVVDEWTLSQTLGATKAKSTIEKHYATFVTESTFADIQAAGFDHVRIPFSYWAITTYDGDPYVPNVSWRYLLRGIEWARKYGLRINLDLHGVPGSQNGWNHSGHQGIIGWLNGTDGTLNGDRTIEIHKQLSTFFTQPRYQNIIALYGLVNEPRMVLLDFDTVMNWTEQAIDTVRGNNFNGTIVFGDGFYGLDNWHGKLSGYPNLLLDAHQYVIFNTQQISLNHSSKLNFACAGWTQQTEESENTNTGFGPTLCGEWSQADTDCATYLNNVGVGSRWEGTLNMDSTPGSSGGASDLTPSCPTNNNPRCDCDPANANTSSYSTEYKQWLLMFAEAQMYSFEQGWGWFYWTWQTESAPQWSYKDALAAGIMPQVAYQRSYNCNGSIPNFFADGLPEYY